MERQRERGGEREGEMTRGGVERGKEMGGVREMGERD